MNLLSSLFKYTADQIAALRAKNTSQDTTVSGINTRLGTAEDNITTLSSRIETAISAVTTDTEVTDIRVGADGITDITAGASVRRQFTDVKNDMYGAPKQITPTMGAFWIFNSHFAIQNGYTGGYFKVSKGKRYVIGRSSSGIIAFGFSIYKFPADASASDYVAVDNYSREDTATVRTYKATQDGYLYVFFGTTTSDTITVYEYTDVQNKIDDAILNDSLIRFKLGTIDDNGNYASSTTRAVTDYIPVSIGDTVTSNTMFLFISCYFDADKNYLGNSYSAHNGFIYNDTMEHNGYVRIVGAKSYSGNLTDADVEEMMYSCDVSSIPITKVTSWEHGLRNSANRISFDIGSLNDTNGGKVDSTTRCRSDFIKCNKGEWVKSSYEFLIFYYDENLAFDRYSYADDGKWIKEKEITEDCYIKILVRKDSNNSTITAEEVSLFEKSVSVSFLAMPYAIGVDLDLKKFIEIRTLDGFAEYESIIGEANALAQSYKMRGKITKYGKQIHGSDGNPIILTGIGTHSLGEYNILYTDEVMKTLLYNGVNCIRASVYLTAVQFAHSDGRTALGWLTDSAKLKPIIENLVDVATDNGLYVILDWHSYHAIDGGDVTQYQTQQEAFFSYFSTLYADYDNILYELHNEPYQNTAQQLLPSVQSCSSIIRANNPDAIILCGNGLDGAITMNTLFNTQNDLDIFISVHLYTGDQAITTVSNVVDAGVPVFVSEWGNSSLSGTDYPNDARAIEFFNYLHQNGISYCLWKMTYQDMDTAVLRHDTFMERYSYAKGGWQKSDLSHNGRLYFNSIQQYRFNKHTH